MNTETNNNEINEIKNNEIKKSEMKEEGMKEEGMKEEGILDFKEEQRMMLEMKLTDIMKQEESINVESEEILELLKKEVVIEKWNEERRIERIIRYLQEVNKGLIKNRTREEIINIFNNRYYEITIEDMIHCSLSEGGIPVGPQVFEKIIEEGLKRERILPYGIYYLNLFLKDINKDKTPRIKELIKEMIGIPNEEEIKVVETRYLRYHLMIKKIIQQINHYDNHFRNSVEFYEGYKEYLKVLLSSMNKEEVKEEYIKGGLIETITRIEEFKSIPINILIPQNEQKKEEKKKEENKSQWEPFPIDIYEHRGFKKTIEMKIKRVSKINSLVRYKKIEFLITNNDSSDDIYIKYQKRKLKKLISFQ